MAVSRKYSIFNLISIAILCCFSGHSYADDNPGQTVAKALLCFSNKFVYSGCEEEFRLNESGHLNVPVEATELFCNGPCLAETQFVLNCVDRVFSDFLFFNKARVGDVRTVLNMGCSQTNQRGYFNVGSYITDNNGQKLQSFNSFHALTLLAGSCFLIL
ncbi:hypothetical protein Ddye_026936 [Dipteronia dyeriana]|uniref:DUF7731 domain-containing protein n=1 Tax=Dipteronia dyeriana TaxID=168575 RepID=A0AAD9TNS5_9ROSI|nr:hypothetical protein Ddye_026936 [Dipteronia dyeriana]